MIIMETEQTDTRNNLSELVRAVNHVERDLGVSFDVNDAKNHATLSEHPFFKASVTYNDSKKNLASKIEGPTTTPSFLIEPSTDETYQKQLSQMTVGNELLGNACQHLSRYFSGGTLHVRDDGVYGVSFEPVPVSEYNVEGVLASVTHAYQDSLHLEDYLQT